jgi:hypothetical protein
VPTIQDPDTQTFYLVPESTGNNVYSEWVYVGGSWERFGAANLDLSAYATTANPVFTGSISLGRKASTTVGTNSVAIGSDVVASASYAHAEGQRTENSVTFNNTTYNLGATATASHSEGYNTGARGDYSHAEGYRTTAKYHSHAEGGYTTASGYSHAEGLSTIASGEASHAEGYDTSAIGKYSHAEGWNTQTLNQAEHASGTFNKSTVGTTLFSVGNGTDSDNCKNAFEIAVDSSIYINDIGNYDGTNVDSSTV